MFICCRAAVVTSRKAKPKPGSERPSQHARSARSSAQQARARASRSAFCRSLAVSFRSLATRATSSAAGSKMLVGGPQFGVFEKGLQLFSLHVELLALNSQSHRAQNSVLTTCSDSADASIQVSNRRCCLEGSSGPRCRPNHCVPDSIQSVWCLVGNGGMGYGDYSLGVYRDYYRDPFPHSLLSTRQQYQMPPCRLEDENEFTKGT